MLPQTSVSSNPYHAGVRSERNAGRTDRSFCRGLGSDAGAQQPQRFPRLIGSEPTRMRRIASNPPTSGSQPRREDRRGLAFLTSVHE